MRVIYKVVFGILAASTCLHTMERKQQAAGELAAVKVRIHRKKKDQKKNALVVVPLNNPPGGADISSPELLDDDQFTSLMSEGSPTELLQKYRETKSSQEAVQFFEHYQEFLSSIREHPDRERFEGAFKRAQIERAQTLLAQHNALLAELTPLIQASGLDKDDQDALRVRLTKQLDKGKRGLQRRCLSCCGKCSCRS